MSNLISERVGKTVVLSIYDTFLKNDKNATQATVVMNDCVYIKITIRKNKNGEYFICYPSYKDNEKNKYTDLVFAKKIFNDEIIKTFEKMKQEYESDVLPDNIEIEDISESLPF